MTGRRARAAVVTAVVGISACTTGGAHQSHHSHFDAAITTVVNPSTHRGGVLRYAAPGAPDSFDPGNTYFFNAPRLWSRALVTFRPLPGAAGLKPVPDLATSLGKVSDAGHTWTYTIRPGLRYSDGSPIVSADVKYAVERSNFAPEVLADGPSYFRRLLVDNEPPYRGPYRDKTGDLQSIETPDDRTVVFHLKEPFADFDYLASFAQTAPVPQRKDTGADYVQHMLSSGSYTVKSYHQSRGAVLVRNPYWDGASDPIRKQYPAEIHFAFDRDQQGIDDDLIAGNLDLDFGGNGMASGSQQNVLSSRRRKDNADNAVLGAVDFLELSTKVKPLDDVNCRRAIQYGVDKVSFQNAIGGPLRGQIASTVLPPTIRGHADFNLYPSRHDSGDLVKARAALARCGHPHGFAVNLGTLLDQPALVAGADSLQASLARIGVAVTTRRFSAPSAWSSYLGAPTYVHSHDLGLLLAPWSADWSDGYGFLENLVDGRAIAPSGNSNLSELDDPRINAMFDRAMRTSDATARDAIFGHIDRAVVATAAIVPLVYRKELTYRAPNTTNVTVSQAYGGYDLLNVGTE